MRERRKRPRRRRRQNRRRSDFYTELGKAAGLIASLCAGVYGQDELLGEPWRHYVTLTAFASTAVWAYCLKPGSMKGILQAFKGRRT